jgi:NHL repeat
LILKAIGFPNMTKARQGTVLLVAVVASATLFTRDVHETSLVAQGTQSPIQGPTGPSPYEVVRDWHKPFAEPGFAFGGNSGVFAESPTRIFIAQRGETRLPTPVPPGFAGFAGSIGINVLSAADRRVWRNCLYTVDGEGRVKERWTQWDHLCEGSTGPGPHRVRISPYDPQRRVWVINETFHQIYVFSNDGSKLLATLGEKNVPGTDGRHFAKPQDVAFLPDGRILIADGLDNHRVMILDRDMTYLGEFGSKGDGPGQFNGVHAIAVGPENRIFALDRSGRRVNVFKTTPDPARVDFVAAWPGLSLPLDLIVNDDSLWVTDLGPLRFIKMDFTGRHLYTWLVPKDLPDGYLEAHTISVDAAGNLYAGDNQYGRTQKWIPKRDANRDHLIRPPWVAR